MAHSHQRYRYSPLSNANEIRLLRPLNHSGDQLRYELSCADLDTTEFTALSYAWGSQEIVSSILVGDSDGTLPSIPITQSLRDALGDLRASSYASAGYLWIDQICIDQGNLTEKSLQVAMMGRIYSTAKLVISYLGPGERSDTAALELLSRIDDHFAPWYQSDMLSFDKMADYRLKYRDPSQIPRALRFTVHQEDDAWKALEHIVLGPWTKRLWMLQETLLNQNIIMLRGSRIIQFRSLLAIVPLGLLNLLPRVGITIPGSEDAVFIARWSWFVRQSLETSAPSSTNMTAVDVFLGECSTRMACADPRHRVFAILGLASDVSQLGIVADYSKSLEDVLLDAALRMMQLKRFMEPLKYWEKRGVEDTVPPSWVPTWTSISHSHLGYNNASKDLIGSCVFNEADRSITLRGIQLSTITWTSEEIPVRISWPLSKHDILILEEALRGTADNLKHKDGLELEICRCMTGGDLDEDWHEKTASIALQTFQKVLAVAKDQLSNDNSLNKIRVDDILKQSSYPEKDLVDQLLARSILEGRSLCVTSSQRVCLAPGHTQQGDVLALILGGPDLYILRPTNKGFRYVGDAYVFGFMDGQILEKQSWESEVTDFHIY